MTGAQIWAGLTEKNYSKVECKAWQYRVAPLARFLHEQKDLVLFYRLQWGTVAGPHHQQDRFSSNAPAPFEAHLSDDVINQTLEFQIGVDCGRHFGPLKTEIVNQSIQPSSTIYDPASSTP